MPQVCAKRTVGDAGPYVLTPRSGISHLPQANISHCGSNISHRRQAVYHSSPKAMSINTPLRHASRATSPQGARQDSVGARGCRILRGVRTIFLGPLTEGAVERMRDWGSLTFNTPSVGYADTSLTREARVLCGFGGELVGAAICRPSLTPLSVTLRVPPLPPGRGKVRLA